MHHQCERPVVEGCRQWSDVAIILAPVGSGGADGGVNVMGQNNEGGWQTIKWHIVRHVGTSVNVHMAGQHPKKYMADVSKLGAVCENLKKIKIGMRRKYC